MRKRKKCISCSKIIYEYKDLVLEESTVIPKNIGRIAVPCIYYVDDCEALMCLPCSSEEVTLVSGVKIPGVCPECELIKLEDLEKLGLYFRENGQRDRESQLWAQAFRVTGTDTFMGMCPEAIFEHLEKMGKKRENDD